MITMTQSLPVMAAKPQTASVAPQSAPEAQTQDTVSTSKHIDEKNFSWLDLGKGVAGSVVAGSIEGVGGLAAGLIKSPVVTYEAVKGVWTSKMIGPILASTLTPVIIAGGIAAPALTAVAGLGYGMFEGFVKGSEENPLAAGGQAIETCKKMHGHFTKEIVNGIREAASKKPEKPEDVYEIKVIDGGKGLISSVASAAVDGVGAAGTVALHIPQGYLKATKEIWKSDAALPLKVGGQFLATAAAAVAIPLAGVAGVLYGLGTGAYNGYQHGVVEGVKKAGHDISELHQSLNKIVRD